MSSAWTFQEAGDVQRLGEDGAPWHVSWYEPSGRRKKKSFGAGARGKRLAEEFRRKVEAQLMTGTYDMRPSVTWDQFVEEYTRRVLGGRAERTREEALAALRNFQRIVKPVRVFAIDTGHIDDFIAARRKERSHVTGGPLSPATVNKDLRHIKAALGKAKKWGYLKELPEFDMEREPGRLPTYIPPDHFAALYQACEAARWPDDQPYPAADWWRGLFITAYMTGWRISQILSLRREDVDLEKGTAFGRAEENKGKRDVLIPLHPLVVEHLKRLPGFSPVFFPWNHADRRIYDIFDEVQTAAGVKPDRKKRYGFHDLRRAFATMNADRLTPDALQALMQHKCYKTTQVYISVSRQLNPAVEGLFVPDLKKPAKDDQERGAV